MDQIHPPSVYVTELLLECSHACLHVTFGCVCPLKTTEPLRQEKPKIFSIWPFTDQPLVQTKTTGCFWPSLSCSPVLISCLLSEGGRSKRGQAEDSERPGVAVSARQERGTRLEMTDWTRTRHTAALGASFFPATWGLCAPGPHLPSLLGLARAPWCHPPADSCSFSNDPGKKLTDCRWKRTSSGFPEPTSTAWGYTFPLVRHFGAGSCSSRKRARWLGNSECWLHAHVKGYVCYWDCNSFFFFL